jgi:hypothetical protein
MNNQGNSHKCWHVITQVKRLEEAGNQPVVAVLRVGVTDSRVQINMAHMNNQSFSNWGEERVGCNIGQIRRAKKR